jgi:tryptophan synthase alpha chain
VSPVDVRRRTGDLLTRLAAGTADSPGRAALIGYLPLGYPDVPGSVDAALAMVDAGVDIVELGIPYSDPVMDGPTIQHAVEHALAGGTHVRDVFGAVERVAASGAPVLVMTYWNPVLRYGVDAFARDLAAAGGAGLITPDLIPDEAGEWIAASDAHGLDRVFLVAPSSTAERLASTSAASASSPEMRSSASRSARTSADPTITPSAYRATCAACSPRETPRPTQTCSAPAARVSATSCSACVPTAARSPVTPMVDAA